MFSRIVQILTAAFMVISLSGCTGTYHAGTYTGTAAGRNGDVTVEVTLSKDMIESVVVKKHNETRWIASQALEIIPAQIVEKQTINVDGVSGATLTSNAIMKAAGEALKTAGVDITELPAKSSYTSTNLTFNPGTYTGEAQGYNGTVGLNVTFSEKRINAIEVAESSETEYVGTPAFDIMLEDARKANGSGVDLVSGATYTSAAIRNALNDAASQAEVSDLIGFKKNTLIHRAGQSVNETYDVVVIGAGGAGMSAAAQAAQDGNSVLVIDKNAEIGGNTVVSGGSFQSVMPYLVWDESDPDAVSGIWEYNGKSYDKVMSSQGCIDTLKIIAEWSEEPFDEEYYRRNEFVNGDIEELSTHGVHEEYLETLQTLKTQIHAYLEWAQPKLDAGIPENQITLFSTKELHIFQTYYGGLRRSDDKKSWIYGEYELVSQMVNAADDLKSWLADQGACFADDMQGTSIGSLWYRGNDYAGGDTDGDGIAETSGVWGTYFETTRNTLLNESVSAQNNKIMLRTTVNSLIMDNGAVTGVVAEQYNGTRVTIKAEKGVVLATGGYAADITKVQETNTYWDEEYINDMAETTNRSFLQINGLTMGTQAGGTLTGTGYTQLMPVSWIDNGDDAFGSGTDAVYINPVSGERFVDEASETDVLAEGALENGIVYKDIQGVFLEFSNASQVTDQSYSDDTDTAENIAGRIYFVSGTDELQEVLDHFDMRADPEVIYETIRSYDQAVMNGEQPAVNKSRVSGIIGSAEMNDDGTYNTQTYNLEGEMLCVRVLAPSAHYTMGGLKVDTERHVLSETGNVIQGLYAAGEVTGGIHGGNCLAGNAITDALVSGRIAAESVSADYAASQSTEG